MSPDTQGPFINNSGAFDRITQSSLADGVAPENGKLQFHDNWAITAAEEVGVAWLETTEKRLNGPQNEPLV